MKTKLTSSFPVEFYVAMITVLTLAQYNIIARSIHDDFSQLFGF